VDEQRQTGLAGVSLPPKKEGRAGHARRVTSLVALNTSVRSACGGTGLFHDYPPDAYAPRLSLSWL